MENKLDLMQFQSYYDENTHEPLTLKLDLKYSFKIGDINVVLDNMPLLVNENNNEVFFPEKLKAIISCALDRRPNNPDQDTLIIRPEAIEKGYFKDFLAKFPFQYSWLDYEFIPGLYNQYSHDGFLIPIFFNLSILDKFAQNPDYDLDLFSDTHGYIKHKDWGVCFGINKNKRVILWLGDIETLPDNEIYYLLSENIPSDHEIHSEFYDAQIEAEWSNPSQQNQLLKKRSSLKETVKEKYGFNIYTLDGEVSEVIKELGRPVFWQEKHIAHHIESLNRIFIESINVKAIKDYLKAEVRLDSSAEKELKNKGGLKVFEFWLSKNFNVDMDEAKTIMCPFFVLYDLRIICNHLTSHEKRKEILNSIRERLGINQEEDINYEVIHDRLIDELLNSYEKIIKLCS